MAEAGARSSGAAVDAWPRVVRPGVLVYPDPPAVARGAAELFVEWAAESIARDGSFCVALAGGTTPRAMYRELASPAFRDQVDWADVHVFWGNERAVPPSDPESNFGMAWEAVLSHVPIPADRVHRMQAERGDLEDAAQDYAAVLARYLAVDARGMPRLHAILLGLGVDGHTASLFPGAPLERDPARWVAVTVLPGQGTRRMTLTLPMLNAAQRVLFQVTGADKAVALRQMLDGTGPPVPAQLVTVPDGLRLILADSAACASPARAR